MIEVTDLTRYYGSVKALQGVSFRVEGGQVVGFLGPNGAGKTTTMRILTGYLAPTSGKALVHGVDVAAEPQRVQRRIGYLPEGNPLYSDLRVDECLRFAADMQGLRGPSRRAAIAEALDIVQMTDKSHRTAGTLSRGEKQRVGLAQALLHQPDVLILDEPTSGLDPNQQRQMRALIRTLGERRTVLFSTHILSEVEAVCARVMIVAKGRLVADGTVAEVRGEGTTSTIVEVRASPEVAAAAFAGLPGVQGIEASALPSEPGVARVVLSAPLDRALGEAVVARAAERGLRVSSIVQEAPSLERVFNELTTAPADEPVGAGVASDLDAPDAPEGTEASHG
jgi:ABC-2 type transport system ATP-binding protein